MLTSAEIIVEVFKKWGVEKIFGTPSNLESPLLSALQRNSQIEFVNSYEDHLGVSLAQGYAKLSGKVGVVNFGTAEGALNSLGFIKSAFQNQSPLVIICALPAESLDIFENDNFGQSLCEQVKKYAKWSWKVTSAGQTVFALQKALKFAQTPPCGPTFITIPQDIFSQKTDQVNFPLNTSRSYITGSPVNNLERISLSILKAKNPLIIAGPQVADSHTQGELAEISEILGTPVISEASPTGSQVYSVNMQYYHPFHLGFYYKKDQVMNSFLKNTDCVLEIGTKGSSLEMIKEINPRAIVIHQTDNPEDLNKNHTATFALLGDLKNNLTDLIATVKRYQWPYEKQIEKRKKINRQIIQKNLIERQKVLDLIQLSDKVVKPLHLIKALNEVFSKDTVFIDESGSFSGFLKRFFRFIATHEVFGMVGEQYGWGIPFATGAAFMNSNKKKFVCLVSDASFLKAIQSLLVTAKYKLPLVVITINNKGFISTQLGLKISAKFDKKKMEFLSLAGNGLNLETIAQGTGVKTFFVNKPQELTGVFNKAVSLKGPVVVDVQMTDDLNEWAA